MGAVELKSDGNPPEESKLSLEAIETLAGLDLPPPEAIRIKLLV